MTTISRAYQMFPVLDAAQVETARRFASGPDVRFVPGQAIYGIGDRDTSAWLVLDGTMDVLRRASTTRLQSPPIMRLSGRIPVMLRLDHRGGY